MALLTIGKSQSIISGNQKVTKFARQVETLYIKLKPQGERKYKMNYDVIVVGGGISGVMAAITAARNGARTLVMEQYGFLGGMLTAAGVGPMMTFHVEDRQVVKGTTGELIERMMKKGKSPGHVFDSIGYTYTVTPFDAEAMKHELELMLLESGAVVLYHTMLSDVKVKEGVITGITVTNKAGISEMNAKVFIDATGDGDLSAWSGVEFTKGRLSDGAAQPMTMNMKMNNVDTEAIKDYVKENPDEFPYLKGKTWMVDKASKLSISGFARTAEKGLKDKSLRFDNEGLLFFETNNPGEVIINTTRIRGLDATNPWDLTRAEIEGRRQVRNLEQFFREHVRGFENAVLLGSGPAIGVRGSRQIKGIYTLTLEDLNSSKKFPDVIAHAGYPIDVHSPDGKEVIREEDNIAWGSMYSVPYRCLVNHRITNLVTVGRCISATFEAQGAIRTTPIAGAIGQAGGAGAYLASKFGQKASEVDISKVQEILMSEGAYLIL